MLLPQVRLVAPKPSPEISPPTTLGEHLKRARLIKGQTQKQAAAALNVAPETLINWEKDRTKPPYPSWPSILGFLGYDPHPRPQTLPERMQALRRVRGWTTRHAAALMGVDEGSWQEWERNGPPAWPRYQVLLNKFVDKSLGESVAALSGTAVGMLRTDCRS